MAQSVAGAWAALVDAMSTLFAGDDNNTLVSPGEPGNYQPDLIVAVMGIPQAPITHPTLGPGRSQDLRITVQVLVSQYVHGGPEAQAPAIAGAVAAAEQIRDYFRVSGNEKLGGTCYNAFVSAMPVEVATAWETEDGMSAPAPVGRTATVDVSVEIWIRR